MDTIFKICPKCKKGQPTFSYTHTLSHCIYCHTFLHKNTDTNIKSDK